MLRFAALMLVLLAAPAAAEEVDPTLTIDQLVEKGLVSEADKAAFVSSFADSCRMGQAKPDVNAKTGRTEDQIAVYCTCHARASTGAITLADINLIEKAGGKIPETVAAKLAAIAKTCNGSLTN